jgi:hypothetical protein
VSARESDEHNEENDSMTVIDTHTHFFPHEWVGLLEREASNHGATMAPKCGRT